MPKAVIFIAAGMLFVGVLSLPYGYYMLLRIVACGVFAWAAFITYEKNEEVVPWVFGILAIVFNPLIKIHFSKELWAVVDFCSGLFLLIVSKKLISNEQDPT
ncbi:DUF6804 family protein [Hahella chejuensis]|uniref:DUF6804 family protein n=1 Tax=Hahella chejuensis TaxID=158327 RepID=UPI00067432B8|nr:DUF6804 family protein [Hahella chejuensis]